MTTETKIQSHHTTTGNILIGMRRVIWHELDKDLRRTLDIAKAEGLSAIDLGKDADQNAQQVRDEGFSLGPVDIPERKGLITADEEIRKASVERTCEYFTKCAAQGVNRYLTVLQPHNKKLSRSENHDLAAIGLNAIAPTLEETNSYLVLEGFPGGNALACTPDGLDRLFKDVPSKHIAINYDPSHLVRMGIDYLRFLDEYKDRIYHAHAKDTAVDADKQYRFGYEVGPNDDHHQRFHGTWWRYAVPGAGVIDWTAVCERLATMPQVQHLTIELEDSNFEHTEEDVINGLRASRDHLKTA